MGGRRWVTLPRAGIFGSARVAPGGPVTATYQTATSSATDLSSYSFASQPIGTASGSRRVVVAIGWAAAGAVTLSSVTIGGVSASIDADSGNANGNRRVYFASAVVPTGTTATVAITLSGTVVRLGIGVWTLSGGSPTGQTAAVINADAGTLTVTTSVDDVVLAAGFLSHTSNSVTTTWTNATERYDAQIENVFNAHSGADTIATTTSTGVGFSDDVTTTNRAFLAAAYA